MRWLVVVMLLVGCEKSQQCRTDADDLVRYLRGLDQNIPPFVIGPSDVPVRDDLPARPLPYADDVVRVLPQHVEYASERYAGDDTLPQLGERLAHTHARSVEFAKHRYDIDVIYLVIDKSVTWNRVVAVFETVVRAGFTRPAFVFVGSRPNKRPPPSKLDARLAVLERITDRSITAPELAALMTEAIGDCPSMKKPFRNYGGGETRSRTEILLDELPDDLVKCSCRVDIASLRAILWHLLTTPVPTYYVAVEAFPPGRSSSPRVLEATAEATWETVSKSIDENVLELWLAVARQ